VNVTRLEREVLTRRGGQNFTLGMLGRVEPSFDDPEYFVRANGQNVVQIAVEKRSGANTVTVSRSLRKALPRIQESLPFEASFHIDDDQGEDLREKLQELVYRSLIILAILFLLLAAGLRQIRLTAIVTASIAFAIVISLSLFYFLKLSVNFITISGLTVCFGLILDNSILVLDSIHRRLKALDRAEESQLSRRTKLKVALEMIVAGTREVSFPILATTLTTMVAFLAFIFLTGRLAVFYVPLAVAVATAMTASLFVAFGWIPVALNQGWAAPLVRRLPDGPNTVADTEIHAYVEDLPDLGSRPKGLEAVFHWTQRLWWLILPPATALLVWGFAHVYKDKVIKGGFWRIPDQEELIVYMEMPAGTDLVMTTEVLSTFEEALLPIPEGARMTSTTWGGNRGYIRIEFEDELLSTEYPTLYRLRLVEVADATGGASIFIRGFSERPYFKGPFRGSALNSLVKLTGYNSRQLGSIAEEAQRRVSRNRRARNARITSGYRFDRSFQDETVLTIDRDLLAEHGLSVVEVVGYIRRLLGVDTPWTMLIEGRKKRVQLAYEDSETIEYSDVAEKVIFTSTGERLKLGDLVALETRPVKGTVVREDQRYTMYVNWEYVGTDRMRRNFIQQVIDEMDLPYGYAAEEATMEFITPEEESELILMAVLASVFIFVILAALFDSLSLPFLVLLSIPLALVGVFITFWITAESFDSSAKIGLVLLFGIVVNNAILLASRFRTEAALILKARMGGDPEAEAALFPGMRKCLGGSDLWLLPSGERAEMLRRAVARGTRIRLRSIVLTSSTTVVGLAPLLIDLPWLGGGGGGEGRDIWENLALTSIGGLVSSTVLILLAIPPLYYFAIRAKWIALRFAGWIRSHTGGWRRRRKEAPPVPA
jgi:HAE1 family hydrophobic/amphiphilic exporter-1